MGIPYYFSYIIRNYSVIVRHEKMPEIAHLFMDCNSMIYDAYRSVLEDAATETNTPEMMRLIIDKVIYSIEQYIAEIKPSKTIYIAFDGVAPYAKIMQQRERRYKATMESGGSGGCAAANDDWKNKFHTVMITPGTEFMELLSMRITRHFSAILGAAGAPKYIISTSNEPGEGEHKICEYIRRECSASGVSFAPAAENACIYGLDADLIMLAINHVTYFKNIYVFRESSEFHKAAGTTKTVVPDSDKIVTENDLSTEKYIFIDIDRLNHYISVHSGAPSADYIVLCFFLGNDFMPHFPALNIRTHGIDILLETYKKHYGRQNTAAGATQRAPVLIKDGKIQWRKLATILREIGTVENTLLLDEEKSRQHLEKKYANLYNKLSEEERQLHSPVIYREMEKYICPAEEGWEYRYYRVLFDIDITENGGGETAIKEICMNYLQGLQWTYNYYSNSCIDWSWTYKYHYPPLIQDLVKHIPYFETNFFEDVNPGKPLSANEQLKLVLPPKYRFLLRGEDDDEPQKTDQKPYIMTAYCRYNWESHLFWKK